MSRAGAASWPIAPRHGAVRAGVRLARVSLSMTVFAVCCASCLVTSIPEFEDPPQAPPELIAASATPDLRNVVQLDANSGKQTFSVLVRAAENDTEPLSLALYLDYGVCNAEGKPYRRRVDADIPESTTSGEPRLARATLVIDPDSAPLDDGCHTITMMVSHAFDRSSGCPERIVDSDYITWFVDYCGSGTCADPAPCPVVSDRCPDEADTGGGGAAGEGICVP